VPCIYSNPASFAGADFSFWVCVCSVYYYYFWPVIHQVAQAGFPEEPPKNEQAMLIHAEFSDSAGPEKAHFPVFPLL
jgi:hypothetical protein